jgi:tRNA nucleotidyltransferase (CCA-adding enzyme)
MPNLSDCSSPGLKPLIPRFVTFILNRLKNAGHQAYIVGGAVRDACLFRGLTDWDVATSAQPEDIKALFRDIRLFTLKQGTVTLVNSGDHFEVTSFRGIKNHIKDDLAHRDLTINAMAYDAEKDEILDPYGGRKDMARKLIKATGDPETRFREDPLRLLRAVRLAAELRFGIDTGTRDAITRMACQLSTVPPERIREELMKMLMSPRPSIGFKMMRETGLLKNFLPELLEGYLKRQNAHHRYTIFKHIMETIDSVRPVPVLRLTALLHDIAKPRIREKIGGKWRFFGHAEASAVLSEEIMGRLRFSSNIIKKVTSLIRYHMIDYHSGWSDGAVRRLIRRVGQDQIMDLLDFRKADILAHGLHHQEVNLLTELRERVENLSNNQMVTKSRDLAINGHKVMEILRISPGPEVGNILKRLVETVTDNPELNTEEGLVATLDQRKTI